MTRKSKASVNKPKSERGKNIAVALFFLASFVILIGLAISEANNKSLFGIQLTPKSGSLEPAPLVAGLTSPVGLYMSASEAIELGDFAKASDWLDRLNEVNEVPIAAGERAFSSAIRSGDFDLVVKWSNWLTERGGNPVVGILMQNLALWEDNPSLALKNISAIGPKKARSGTIGRFIISSASLWLKIELGELSQETALKEIENLLPIISGQERLHPWRSSQKLLLTLGLLKAAENAGGASDALKDKAIAAANIVREQLTDLPLDLVRAVLETYHLTQQNDKSEELLSELALRSKTALMAQAATQDPASIVKDIAPREAFSLATQYLAFAFAYLDLNLSLPIARIAQTVTPENEEAHMTSANILKNMAGLFADSSLLYQKAIAGFQSANLVEQNSAGQNSTDQESVNKESWLALEKILQIARIYSQMDDVESSLKELEKAESRWPDIGYIFHLKGDILRLAERHEEAIEPYSIAIAKSPKPHKQSFWRLLFRRATVLAQTNRWEEAEKDFLWALELSPNQPEVLNYLGYSWLEQGQHIEKSLAMIKLALEGSPNSGYIVDSLGWAYYKLDRFEEAIEQLEHALILDPSDATINDHMGDAYWRVGRKREAVFQWKRAQTFEAINPSLSEDVKKILKAKVKNGL